MSRPTKAVASAPEYGGYDHKFAGKVPERLMCNICMKVLREPHLTVCCGQHFCNSCLENWFKKQQKKSCPHCREEGFNYFLNKALKREIDELKIHCTHRGEGCQWIGELGNLQTHLNSRYKCKHCSYEDTHQQITTFHYNKCPEYPLDCPNKCGAKSIKRNDMSAHRDECPEETIRCPNKCGFYRESIKRKDLPDHLSNECYLRKYKCEYCGRVDTYEKITGERNRTFRQAHYDTCREYPLECPNTCWSLTIKRKDMSAHRDKCPEEPMECPFKEAGCETKLVRRVFDDHVQTQTQQHLLLAFQKMKALSTTCETLRKRNDELSKSNDELNKSNDKLRKRMIEYDTMPTLPMCQCQDPNF